MSRDSSLPAVSDDKDAVSKIPADPRPSKSPRGRHEHNIFPDSNIRLVELLCVFSDKCELIMLSED